ncbi:MAG: hypothetical protein GX604_04355 [Actinobacteria bacterium]|nr:hypothetical protein [Actinomycetota bacterium]
MGVGVLGAHQGHCSEHLLGRVAGNGASRDGQDVVEGAQEAAIAEAAITPRAGPRWASGRLYDGPRATTREIWKTGDALVDRTPSLSVRAHGGGSATGIEVIQQIVSSGDRQQCGQGIDTVCAIRSPAAQPR